MAEEKSDAPAPLSQATEATPPPRKIPGNLPYLPSSGTLKKVLEKIIEAQRPDKFTADFLANVLKLSGGTPRATIPILKKMAFLTSDGVPTDLYGRFRTDTGRASAALQGLKTAYAEIFKRSEYAHLADDGKIKDLIVEITGLKSNDPVAGYIRANFNAIKSFIPPNFDGSTAPAEEADEVQPPPRSQPRLSDEVRDSGIRLAYNINIVLPETSDLNVLNAIFRSLRDNLMK